MSWVKVIILNATWVLKGSKDIVMEIRERTIYVCFKEILIDNYQMILVVHGKDNGRHLTDL